MNYIENGTWVLVFRAVWITDCLQFWKVGKKIVLGWIENKHFLNFWQIEKLKKGFTIGQMQHFTLTKSKCLILVLTIFEVHLNFKNFLKQNIISNQNINSFCLKKCWSEMFRFLFFLKKITIQQNVSVQHAEFAKCFSVT